MKMANLGIERAWELRTLFLFVWGNDLWSLHHNGCPVTPEQLQISEF
jgi:hypothetical protein